MYQLMVRGFFCAAHKLMFYDGKCENLHGHNYKVEVFINCHELDKIGLGVDFYHLKKMLGLVLNHFDHTVLNELPEFHSINPSAENISRIIYRLFFDELIKYKGTCLAKVNVWESENCMASYFEQ